MGKKQKNISNPKIGMSRTRSTYLMEESVYTFMMNGQSIDESGNQFTLSNEHSNILANKFKAGYKVVGHKNSIVNKKTYFFLHNPKTKLSEIGYIDNDKSFVEIEDLKVNDACNPCIPYAELGTPLEGAIQEPHQKYTTILADCQSNRCLNFSLDNPIMSIELKIENVGEVMAFAHKGNPPRYIELDNLEQYSHIGEEVCGREAEPVCLDCEKMKIFSNYKNPTVKNYERVLGGSLRKGVYEVALAYCDALGNEKTTYTFIVSPPISIFDEGDVIYDQTENNSKTNYSIRIGLNRLDSRFTHYKVVVIEDVSQTTDRGSLIYYEKGVYPTTQTDVLITDNEGDPISENKVRNPLISIDSWEGLTSANGYLIGTGVKQTEEVNLQPVFNLMGGLIKWQSSVVKGDLYKAANSNRYKSYNRDEVYPISIRPISEDGYQYPKYILPGRPATEYELEDVDLEDINIQSTLTNLGECDGALRTKNWQYFNTATYKGRCDTYNSGLLSFFGFDGEGDILINGNIYNVGFVGGQNLDEVIQDFVDNEGPNIEAVEGVVLTRTGDRVVLNPLPDSLEFMHISGSLEVEIDRRGLPTVPQTEKIEILTQVPPLTDSVTVTLKGTQGVGRIKINGNPYLIAVEFSIEEAIRDFVDATATDIYNNEGLTVVAKNNTLVFKSIYSGIVFENVMGDIEGSVSEPGIPPIPSSIGPVDILPKYIDTYKDLKTYISTFIGTCDVEDVVEYENSPIEDMCPYVNPENLESYDMPPVPEDGCSNPLTDFMSEQVVVYDVIGESATYTPKETKDYSDIAPPSNSRVFVKSAGEGDDSEGSGREGKNMGIEKGFSGAYFLRWDASASEVRDIKSYNRTVLEKQYITYAETPDTAVRLQNVDIENRDSISTVPLVHPYHGEMLVGSVVTPAYIELLPLTNGNGDADITIDGEVYNIAFDTNINTTASTFVSQKAADILNNHNLVLTAEDNVLIFDGDIQTSNTPTIQNINGNLRGEVSIGDNLLLSGDNAYEELAEIDEINGERILTDRFASETAVLDAKKVGNLIRVFRTVREASKTKFLSKVHKGAIWCKVESAGRERFHIEITKMLDPFAHSLRRDFDADTISCTYFKNRYIRYTVFEDANSLHPLTQLRDDLAKTEIVLSGNSGAASIIINTHIYPIAKAAQQTIAESISGFVGDFRDIIYETEGQTVSALGDTLTFTGEGGPSFDEATIITVAGDLTGVSTVTQGGYYPMGGIVELVDNHRIKVEVSKLKTTKLFDGDFYIAIDLPITTAIGLGENNVPGDPNAPFYHTAITMPLGSCFSVVTRDEEFSEISVNFEEIRIAKNQNWMMRCTFEVPVVNSCKPIPHKYGEFAYWESTDIYPDNKELYDSSWLKINIHDIPQEFWSDIDRYIEEIDSEGDIVLKEDTNLTCKPIRHFKFPDNKVSPFMYERRTNRDSDVIIYPIGLKVDDSLFNSFMDIAVENGLITQSRRDKIIGYEVYRGDRRRSKSILTSGMLFDMRSYKNDVGDTIYYPNYPYNSLGKDKFNSDINGNDIQLDVSKNHIYTFHSPEQDYYKTGTGFSEASIQGYMFGTSDTVITEVEEHPKFTILSEKAKSLATVLATIEVTAEAVSNIASSGEVYRIQFGMANAINPVGMVFSILNIISNTINLFTTKVGKYRYEWLNTFKNLGTPKNFAYYTTSVAKYNYFRTLQSEENLFRGVATKSVLGSGTHSITENVTGNPLVINSLDREDSLMMTFTDKYPIDHSASSSYLEYINYDNNNLSGRGSQVLSSEAGCDKGQSPHIYRNVASPYVALKTYLPNQYGSIGNINWISTGTVSELTYENCGLVLGGDTFITPHSIKRKMPLFKTTAFGLANQTPFAYGILGNIGNPKYYINYEINTERATKDAAFPEIDSEVSTDCTNYNFYLEEPSKFYLYAYGQPEFFVESSVNTYYRNARAEPWKQFYPQNKDFVRLTQEKEVSIRRGNNFYYNYAYSYPGTNFNDNVLPDYYDSEVFRKKSYNDNSVMYSNQDNNENSIAEPWLSYKPNNYHVFPKSNGKLMKIKGIENKQIIAIFENTTEIYNAVDTFVRGITEATADLGTGGLFAGGAVRTFSETDLGYIGSQSSSILSNEFGHIIVDSMRGQIFNISPGAKEGAAQEISRTSQGRPNGMDVWFKEHLPFKILRRFPDYKEYTDNPYNGVGITMGWDSKFRRVFITKKDYVPVFKDICHTGGKFYDSSQEAVDEIISLNSGKVYKGIDDCKVKMENIAGTITYINLPEISLNDTKYFKDVSWTITYKVEGGNWESYMDFKPNYYISHSDYFQTGVNNPKDPKEFGLWSHLLTNKSKQVFYGKKYPWVVEFPTKNEYAPKNLQGLEINSTAKRYHNEYDYAIDDRVTFNKLNIFSDSQSSGNLELIPNRGTLGELSKYPITHEDRQEVLITRDKGMWNVNYFYNRVKSNRNNLPLFTFDENQIDKVVNPEAVSFYGKNTLEQLTSENFLVRLTQDKTTQFDIELRWVIENTEI